MKYEIIKFLALTILWSLFSTIVVVLSSYALNYVVYDFGVKTWFLFIISAYFIKLIIDIIDSLYTLIHDGLDGFDGDD